MARQKRGRYAPNVLQITYEDHSQAMPLTRLDSSWTLITDEWEMAVQVHFKRLQPLDQSDFIVPIKEEMAQDLVEVHYAKNMVKCEFEGHALAILMSELTQRPYLWSTDKWEMTLNVQFKARIRDTLEANVPSEGAVAVLGDSAASGVAVNVDEQQLEANLDVSEISDGQAASNQSAVETVSPNANDGATLGQPIPVATQPTTSQSASESSMSITPPPAPNATPNLTPSSRPRGHQCLNCGKAYASAYYLKVHQGSHLGEKPFKCTWEGCSSTFLELNNLKRHCLRHTGERPHSCTICGRAFARSDRLKRHYLVHTREKPHSCSICDRAFARLDHLVRHMKNVHKAYKCTWNGCPAFFPRSDRLKRHFLRHTGERPHSCTICEKAFARSDNLGTHMKRIHGANANTKRRQIG